MKGLEGKVALVTGGGRGVGRSLALALAARGVRLVVTGRNERALGETVGEIAYGGGKARHLVGDVRDVEHLAVAVARAVEVFGGLDFAIAAAGQSPRPDAGSDPRRAALMIETNLSAVHATFAAALRELKAGGRLLVANVREGAWDRPGDVGGAAASGHGPYLASKAGVLALVRQTALELVPRAITCNALVAGGEDSFEKVAELAAYLCSSAGASVTGQTITFA